MILIVAAAIMGAAVGLFVQPRIFAIAIAVSVSGATHLVLGFIARLAGKGPGHEVVLAQLEYITFTGVHGIWPVMAAAGTGTLIAALIWSVVRKDGADGFWFPSGGDTDRRKGVRSMMMVEERAVHAEARERLDSILNR
jgi:hypothetical protein